MTHLSRETHPHDRRTHTQVAVAPPGLDHVGGVAGHRADGREECEVLEHRRGFREAGRGGDTGARGGR